MLVQGFFIIFPADPEAYMERPPLCKKHFFEVASYFGKEVAFAFEIDGDGCLICKKQLFLESARRYVDQSTKTGKYAPPRQQAA